MDVKVAIRFCKSFQHVGCVSLAFKAERLRPARCSRKIACQRGGPKSARAPSWAAGTLLPEEAAIFVFVDQRQESFECIDLRCRAVLVPLKICPLPVDQPLIP